MVALLIQIEEIDFKGKQKILARINNFHDESAKALEKQLIASTEEAVTRLLSDLLKDTKLISHARWEDDLEKQDAPTPKPSPERWELNGVKGLWWPRMEAAACDRDGRVFLHEKIPVADPVISGWYQDGLVFFAGKGEAIIGNSWKTMLLKRPEGI